MEELKQLVLANLEEDCWFAIKDKMEELGLLDTASFHVDCLDRTHPGWKQYKLEKCSLVDWATGKLESHGSLAEQLEHVLGFQSVLK